MDPLTADIVTILLLGVLAWCLLKLHDRMRAIAATDTDTDTAVILGMPVMSDAENRKYRRRQAVLLLAWCKQREMFDALADFPPASQSLSRNGRQSST